jgi:hypothetical protein
MVIGRRNVGYDCVGWGIKKVKNLALEIGSPVPPYWRCTQSTEYGRDEHLLYLYIKLKLIVWRSTRLMVVIGSILSVQSNPWSPLEIHPSHPLFHLSWSTFMVSRRSFPLLALIMVSITVIKQPRVCSKLNCVNPQYCMVSITVCMGYQSRFCSWKIGRILSWVTILFMNIFSCPENKSPIEFTWAPSLPQR